ncbi:hypothetical protein [Hymenobacter baengnokdamensis]|uniref:hypothetical protein n=1 Tax=Hymenobacter baengnokdamensis TaxID=2615203 RepID=UPI001246C7CB|nr:hypothetical protein [Hymenobacter baengnokdamensis]
MRCHLFFSLFIAAAPLPGRAQLAQAVPVDSATARTALAGAAQRFPKFYQTLRAVQQHDTLLRRFVVVRSALPLATPAMAFPNGAVRLDLRYLQHSQPGFDDNRLVVVLYHEIGHLHYFRTVAPASRTPEASERAAFDYSLLKTRELADAGDCKPLQTGLYFMRLRSQSADIADPHVQALKSLVREPAYANYQRYVAEHCAASR